jgi:hypothetical protein
LKKKTRDEVKQEDQDQEPSQEDGRDRSQDLEIYSSNFSTKPKISRELFC